MIARQKEKSSVASAFLEFFKENFDTCKMRFYIRRKTPQ